MTIASETSRVNLVGDGVNDTFAFTFEIYADTDVLVYVDDVLQTVDVDYTIAVDSIENPDGGDVVFAAGSIPALDAVVSIILNLPYTQLIDYTEGDKFPAETHERGLDRLVKIAQQHKEKLSRTPSLVISSALSDLIIPEAVSRVIGWDALGEELTTYPITPVLDANWDSIQNYDNDLATAVAEIGAGAKTLLIDVSTELVIANLEVPETLELYPTRTGLITVDNCILTINRLSKAAGPHKIFNCINGGTIVFGTGAVKEVYPQMWDDDVADGVTNASTAINKMLAALPANGGTEVYFPDGIYKVDDNLVYSDLKPIIIHMAANAHFTGAGDLLDMITNSSNLVAGGTYIRLTPNAADNTRVGANNAINGLIVEIIPDADVDDAYSVAGFFGARGVSGQAGHIWGVNPIVVIEDGFLGNAIGSEIDIDNRALDDRGIGLLINGVGDHTVTYGEHITRANATSHYITGLAIDHATTGLAIDQSDVAAPAYGIHVLGCSANHIRVKSLDEDDPTYAQIFGVDSSNAVLWALRKNGVGYFTGGISLEGPEVHKYVTLANDATPSVLGSSLFLTGGTTQITDFDDGVEGQIIHIVSEHTIIITDGTNIFLNGSTNWTMLAADTLTLVCKADNKWYELSRGDNG